MTITKEEIGRPCGVVGDYHDDANALARRAWNALKRGRGMRLSRDEVKALHIMEGDGEWWQDQNPAVRVHLQEQNHE